jgi:hypothetical protein
MDPHNDFDKQDRPPFDIAPATNTSYAAMRQERDDLRVELARELQAHCNTIDRAEKAERERDSLLTELEQSLCERCRLNPRQVCIGCAMFADDLQKTKAAEGK